MTTIADNIQLVKNLIDDYTNKYNRTQHSIKLLAVTKSQPIEKIQEAIQAGQFAFGENYLQEALPKIIALANQSLEWHFIGAIQSNKTKLIAENFSWVHTISDIKIAKH